MNKLKDMKALIVVDAQYDFMPATDEAYANEMGGALAVAEGNEIIPIINELLPKFDLVIFTKDWHPEKMEAFASNHPGKQPFDTYEVNGVTDTLWPSHCVANTRGADIHENIDFSLIKKDFYIFKKGLEKDYHPYSGFGKTGLADFLRDKLVHQVFIVGLALDYCVKDTALDAAKEGFDTIVVEDGTKPISQDLNNLYKEFVENKIQMIDACEFEQVK